MSKKLEIDVWATVNGLHTIQGIDDIVGDVMYRHNEKYFRAKLIIDIPEREKMLGEYEVLDVVLRALNGGYEYKELSELIVEELFGDIK